MAEAAPDALINKDDGRKYWEGVDANANGMLGGLLTEPGFANLSRVDLLGSRSFLAKLGIGARNGLRIVDTALEGGAGYDAVYRTIVSHPSLTMFQGWPCDGRFSDQRCQRGGHRGADSQVHRRVKGERPRA